MSFVGPRIFIFGSCATRDAFELDGHHLELAGYIARTSLASAFQTVAAPEPWQQAAQGIANRFERRMVLLDLEKGARQRIEETAFDCLVLDLIDERFPLALTPDTCATVSRAFTKLAALQPELAGITNRRRWKAWVRGADALIRATHPRPILLNRVFWATHLEDGTELPDRAEAERQNAVLAQMYDHLANRHRMQSIVHESFERTAALEHRWGRAPFHYVEAVYRQTLAALAEVPRAP